MGKIIGPLFDETLRQLTELQAIVAKQRHNEKMEADVCLFLTNTIQTVVGVKEQIAYAIHDKQRPGA